MKKILAIVMAMTMGLGLVACGGGNDTSGSTAEAPAGDAAETGDVPAGGA